MAIFLMFLGLLLFIGLVVLHEFGHFIAARRNGVIVEEFGIGFPPRVWSRNLKNGVKFSLNLLPLGGFVKLKGEHDADKHPGSFGAASLIVKSKIMLAGVAMNLLAALLIFTVVALTGMPKAITKDSVGENQFTIARDTKIIRNDVIISYVEPNSPASTIGLRAGDRLLSLQSINIINSDQLPNITKTKPEQTIDVKFSHNGKIVTAKAQLRSKQEVESSLKSGSPKGYLGISPTDYTVQRSTWSAPVVAVGLSAQLTRLTFKGLWSAIRGLGSLVAGFTTGNKNARQAGQAAASQQVSGPVGIFFILKEGAHRGLGFILFIIGILSLTLAIMNVLPIPALDGGRFYLVLISRKIFHQPLARKTEERIVGSSFVALLLLFVVITFVDIRRFL
ncbi:MAG: RIP metalloprotease RseP [Candidatus Saccharimonadales bacterium]